MGALKAKLTETEFGQLPETVSIKRSDLYTKNGSGYVASVDAVDGLALEDARGLRTALESERQNVSRLSETLKPWEGLNVEEVRAAMIELPTLRQQAAAKTKPNEVAAAQIEELTRKHTGEKDQWSKREAKIIDQLRRQLIDAEATAVMADPTIKGNPHLLLSPIREQTKVVENADGTFKAVVIGEKGSERLTSDKNRAPTDLMTIRELIVEMKGNPKYTGGFIGSSSSGSGATGSDGAGGSSNGEIRISETDAYDSRKYQAAKARAEKEGLKLIIG